jgi:hypothetical protein
MMEAVRTSETSADNYFTRQYIPEDNSELHTSRRENLKCHNICTCSVLISIVANGPTILLTFQERCSREKRTFLRISQENLRVIERYQQSVRSKSEERTFLGKHLFNFK